MKYGFLKVAAAIPDTKIADCEYNSQNIIRLIIDAESNNAKIIVFPELSLTTYTCGDLFFQQLLLSEAKKALERIVKSTIEKDIVVVVGMPIDVDNQLFNCGVVIQSGKILGIVPKTYIPNYSEYYEKRWFASGNKAISSEITLCEQTVPFGTDLLFQEKNMVGVCIGIELCEDLWVPIPPSSYQAIAGAALLLNLSASNEVIGKHDYRSEMVRQQSARCIAGYIYVSAGMSESTTDLVYGGHAIISEYNSILAESQRFSSGNQLLFTEIDMERLISERCKNTSFMDICQTKKFRRIIFNIKSTNFSLLTRNIEPHPFVPSDTILRDSRSKEIFSIQTAGLAKRIRHFNYKHAVIGISGGIDSALALVVIAKTFDLINIPRKMIYAVTMPGFGTTNDTYINSVELIRSMGIDLHEIDIRPACIQHFRDIEHDPNVFDVTYEDVQARERMQIIMDIASKMKGLVVGTGDLSEIALGWCTYNGDHMSMYAVNSGIPKTLVKFLLEWVADNIVTDETRDVLKKIIDTPISPELLPPDVEGRISQKTEDIIGPYELHDFFLYYAVRYGADPRKVLFLAEQAFDGKYDRNSIKKWLSIFYQRFFSRQFKRSCMPDGPKVGTISLSPRGDWRMPSDAEVKAWLEDLEK